MYSNRLLAGIPVPAIVSPMPLPMAVSPVRGGFPSPAEDFAVTRIDLARKLTQHSLCTFILRLSGDSMEGAGIFDGDLLVVDKYLKPIHGDIVIAELDGEFTCKRLHIRNGQFMLRPENPTYPDIRPKDGQSIEIWGVVTSSVKLFRTE
ncbi:LexA family protein [Comamonas terrigena]|uniref:LexA family protein n=1 Tax=Comamonas terrigena TaxID=32013 RepID=UPI0028A9678E|nr:translesion error-prone DNA polymerase V autoproteolytic subunit [Comamonas terrigena]